MIDFLKYHNLGGVGSSSATIQEFYGDGSDGTIINPDSITTAPNGGVVSNLFDMNASTVFTTNVLSSASDQVVFQMDFGTPHYFAYGNELYRAMQFWGISISTGSNRTIAL
jgi:hypothetical protein